MVFLGNLHDSADEMRPIRHKTWQLGIFRLEQRSLNVCPQLVVVVKEKRTQS